MLTKEIVAFGQSLILSCDGKCHKAWGINQRPSIQFDSNDPDDTAFLADGELGEAPIDPGTYEGGHGKPIHDTQKLNKWCYRECERSITSELGQPIKIRDLSTREYNLQSREELESKRVQEEKRP